VGKPAHLVQETAGDQRDRLTSDSKSATREGSGQDDRFPISEWRVVGRLRFRPTRQWLSIAVKFNPWTERRVGVGFDKLARS
jgi:hypothetical protein